MKAIVVYWTATGNTEAIANKIASDTNATVKNVGEVSVEEVLGYDTIILGCPAMGSEELEDGEFKPFYDELIQKVENRRIFLFGSYGWGDGEWMRNWVERMTAAGAVVVGGEGVTCQDAPDAEAEAACKELGKALAAV